MSPARGFASSRSTRRGWEVVCSRCRVPSWSESVSWNTRPAIDGSLLGSFGAVAAGNWYEVEFGAAAVRDGVVSYAIDSTSGDGVRWATRESATPPRLLIDVDDPAGLSSMASPGGRHRCRIERANLLRREPPARRDRRRTLAGRSRTPPERRAARLARPGRQLAEPSQHGRQRSTGRCSRVQARAIGLRRSPWLATPQAASTPGSSGAGPTWATSGPYRCAASPTSTRPTDRSSGRSSRSTPLRSGRIRSDVGFERAPDGSMRGCILYSRRVGTRRLS